jgi:hypothetical protein
VNLAAQRPGRGQGPGGDFPRSSFPLGGDCRGRAVTSVVRGRGTGNRVRARLYLPNEASSDSLPYSSSSSSSSPPLPPAQLPAGPFPFSSFSSVSAHSGAPNSSPPPRRWRSRVFRSRSRESPTPLCAAACGLTSMAFFARLSGRGGNSFFRD